MNLVESALKYASIGWKVFPLIEGTKHPATKNGFKDATVDENIIRRWWTQNNKYNIGIASESIGFVLDIDKKKDKNGFLTLADIECGNDDLPPTVTQVTVSGGQQRLFKLPIGITIPCDRDGLGIGLDVRSSGGYIVAPPSYLHKSSDYEYEGNYEWIEDQSPFDFKLAELPEWMIKLCINNKKDKKPLIVPDKIKDGSRNDILFKFASKLRGTGMKYDEILSATMTMNERCVSPLNNKEIETLVSSSCKYEADDLKWDKTKTGLKPTVRNIINLLKTKYPKNIKYNTFSAISDIDGNPVVDEDLKSIKNWLIFNHNIEPTMQHIDEAVDMVALDNQYHPIRDYLNNLRWDGVKRLDSWMNKYLGVEDNNYTREISKILLIAACARVFNPGCKYDHMVIFESKQGAGKQRVLEALGGDWYAEVSLIDTDKDTVQKMLGGWIIEVAEMRFIRTKAAEAVKAFITTRVDKVRFAYGRKTCPYPRQSVFVGTWNPDSNGYLNDETGNRRFCPIHIGDTIDVDGVKNNRDQLFAEALIEYRNGHPIYIKDDIVSEGMAESQSKSEIIDDWSIQIESSINGTLLDLPDKVTSLDIFLRCLGGSIKEFNHGTSIRIGKCLAFLGCKRVGVSTIGGKKARFFDISNLRKQAVWSE